jgi:CheY-like chemotaxis protein
VDAHTSPEIALAAFQSAPASWDLVILDYTMPLRKGTELALQMKKQRPELPIILITGLVEKEALQLKRAGILSEILIKPLDYQELLQAVKRI